LREAKELKCKQETNPNRSGSKKKRFGNKRKREEVNKGEMMMTNILSSPPKKLGHPKLCLILLRKVLTLTILMYSILMNMILILSFITGSLTVQRPRMSAIDVRPLQGSTH
jgi:hypothetical protein